VTAVTVLAGDIGGTHARLAVVTLEGGRPRILEEHRYPSREYDGLAPIVQEFLRSHRAEPARAVFAVACPVVRGAGRLPNLGWEVDERALARASGIEDTRLINDFDAIGHAIPILGEDDLVPLQGTVWHGPGTAAVIGAGTGLGMGMAVIRDTEAEVHSSEGGHADFAPGDELQARLLAFLRDRFGHVSTERVVSGPGLVNVYEFITESGIAPTLPATRQAMAGGDDPAAAISERGMAGTDPACAAALEIFVSAYGAAAGNLALTVRADAVFVGGGIAPRMLPKLRDGTFAAAFRSKGRLGDLLAAVPVLTIVNGDVGLLGAAHAATHRQRER